jgi:hypothetical protein
MKPPLTIVDMDKKDQGEKRRDRGEGERRQGR